MHGGNLNYVNTQNQFILLKRRWKVTHRLSLYHGFIFYFRDRIDMLTNMETR